MRSVLKLVVYKTKINRNRKARDKKQVKPYTRAVCKIDINKPKKKHVRGNTSIFKLQTHTKLILRNLEWHARRNS